MNRVLIVSSNEKISGQLSQLLQEAGAKQVSVAASGGEARRYLSDYQCEFVVINAPLSDEYGYQVARYTAENFQCGVILLVKGENTEEAAANVGDCGVFIVPKPLSKILFLQAFRLCSASVRHTAALRKENSRLRNSLEEMKFIDRAKCSLVAFRNMTEPQAHHYIEREAMNQRVGKKEIAIQILRYYDLL